MEAALLRGGSSGEKWTKTRFGLKPCTKTGQRHLALCECGELTVGDESVFPTQRSTVTIRDQSFEGSETSDLWFQKNKLVASRKTPTQPLPPSDQSLYRVLTQTWFSSILRLSYRLLIGRPPTLERPFSKAFTIYPKSLKSR